MLVGVWTSGSTGPKSTYGDESSLTAAEAALRGPGDIQERVEVIAAILEKSLTAASSRSQ